ncbi:MAG: flagellar export chaperone FlgN [Hungatella sp.]
MTDYDNLLALLHKHTLLFEELTGTEQAKLEAAKDYDIAKLENCMKKEQADTMVLRGYDKKRLALLDTLQFGNITFTQMIPQLPEEYRYEFSIEFDKLNDAYHLYRETADCAKQIIEINIHRLGIAIDELKKKTNTISGEVYTPEGMIVSDHFSFSDRKV